MGNDKHRNALEAGFELLWYRIDTVLGQGAFGITYLAHDVNLDRKVAIKEYLPSQLCIREESLSVQPLSDEHSDDFRFGLQRFITEARVLTNFEHPNLIRVFNVFEANNTAYMVMNYEKGKSLQSIARNKKQFSENELSQIIIPLMNGLSSMHARGFIHRDIKPGNIFIRDDGSPVLIDFGSARQTRQKNPLTLTNFVSPGYAPIEQYASKSDKQGPWTDIYGFGATLYKLITGIAPVNAIDRSETLTHEGKDCYISLITQKSGEYRENFLKAIDQALAFKAQDRPQSIKAWYDLFDFDEDSIETQPLPVSDTESSTFHVDKIDDATMEVTMRQEDQTETLQHAGESATINLFENAQEKTVRTGSRYRVPYKYIIPGSAVAIAFIITVFYFISHSNPLPEENMEETSQVSTMNNSDKNDDSVNYSNEQTELPAISANNLQKENEISILLQEAEENIEQFRLTSPENDNAYDRYLQVLAMDLDNQAAKAGIRNISDRYIVLADSAIQRNEFERARLYIKKAEEIWPESGKISAANARYNVALTQYRQRQSETAAESQAVTGNEDNTEKKDAREEESVFSDMKKWFRENAEKNKNVQKEDTSSDKFLRSIGGGDN